jgi:hypothetical protein
MNTATPVLLKLTAIETYIGPITKTGEGFESAPVTKGQVCLFERKDADHALAQTRTNNEGEEVPFFKELGDDYEGEIDHDFTTARRGGGTPKRHTDELAPAEPMPVAVPDTPVVAAKAVANQRVPRKSVNR